MCLLRFGGASLAIIAVGLAVAATDRHVDLGTNLRHAHARAGNVGAGALARLTLAPKTLGTRNVATAAARLAKTGRARGVERSGQHDKNQNQAHDDRILAKRARHPWSGKTKRASLGQAALAGFHGGQIMRSLSRWEMIVGAAG